MVNNIRSLDAAFSALADATRRAILARLALGETTVSEIARPFAVSLPAISRHLRVLEDAGLVRRKKTGREHRCSLEPAGLRAAAGWLEEFRGPRPSPGISRPAPRRATGPWIPRRPVRRAGEERGGNQ